MFKKAIMSVVQQYVHAWQVCSWSKQGAVCVILLMSWVLFCEQAPCWLDDIVANGRNSLDVDKLDYLPRDAHYTGYHLATDFSSLISASKVRTHAWLCSNVIMLSFCGPLAPAAEAGLANLYPPDGSKHRPL